MSRFAYRCLNCNQTYFSETDKPRHDACNSRRYRPATYAELKKFVLTEHSARLSETEAQGQQDLTQDGDSRELRDLKDKILTIDRQIAGKQDEMSSYGLSEAGVNRKQREKDALVLQRQELLHKAALQESRERGERPWREVKLMQRKYGKR